MNVFNSKLNCDGQSLEQRTPLDVDRVLHRELPAVDFAGHLEAMAVFLAQTWKDEHPDASVDSDADLNDCIAAVTTELAIAARAVGGPAGLAILTGGGSAAARAVCTKVLTGDRG